MRGASITILIVLVALVVAAFLIFSGDNQQQDSPQNQVPENNSQTETPTDTGQNSPQTYNVEIRNFAFAPSTLDVKVGDTITWTNKDNMQHTVTSNSGNELDSQYLSNGNSYSHTFTQTGTFAYHCTPHPYMKGTVIVG